ncbi:hypothetical protein LVJ94_50925 [Pendulispora rubella]|uniref:PEGA domain-containing protein n=1 Tax=Pendulispora rubella TaxID=2741070 RepID=A0ABZ2L2L9_9BACT
MTKRSVLVSALGCIACLFAPSAAAQSKEQCAAAAEQGQKLRDEKKLVETRGKFLLCASESCPAVVRKDCVNWLSDVDSRTPSVVFRAQTAGARTLSAVRVIVDGQRLIEGLDGRAISMDPGMHKVRFESEGRAPVEQTVVINERERNRAVMATFEDEAASSERGSSRERDSSASSVPPPPAGSSGGGGRTAAFILGGVGLLAAGGAVYFGITGLQETRDYHDGCAKTKNCAGSDVDGTRTKLLLADIGGGVALVSLGVATYLFIRSGSTPKNEARNTPHIALSPIRGGAMAGIDGAW